MRPINVSLDSTTWEMAKQKPNFSEWIREKLHEEYNKNQQTLPKPWLYCPKCYMGTNSPLGWCLHCAPQNVKMVTHKELVALEMEIIDHDHNQGLEE